jgi:hypothetical protein
MGLGRRFVADRRATIPEGIRWRREYRRELSRVEVTDDMMTEEESS